MVNKLFISFHIIVFSCISLYSQEFIHSHHIHEHAETTVICNYKKDNHLLHNDIMHLKGLPRLTYSWANPTISPSPQPTLTGKQMGKVITPGIQPLGFEMDGNVKVFKLYAQPIEQYIIDGKKAEYESLIPEKNKIPHNIMHHFYTFIPAENGESSCLTNGVFGLLINS